MLSPNLTVVFAVAIFLATGCIAKTDTQPAWSDEGGACTNCTICPYSCRGQTQPPPVGPQVPPGGGWYAPPGAGIGLPGYPSGAGSCTPGTTPGCCQQQQQQNPNNNPNFNYYYNSPPYTNVPYNGGESRNKPFGVGLLVVWFLAFLWELY